MTPAIRIGSPPTRLAGWLLAASVAAVGCVHHPSGPSVMVLPGSGSSFDQFRSDDAQCRSWATGSTGESPDDAAARSGVGSAAVGTAVGAAAGAAIGAATGHPAEGLAIGAGSGLLLGAAGGADRAAWSGRAAQRRYDATYMQCMYAEGHRIPVPRSSVPGAASQHVPRSSVPGAASQHVPRSSVPGAASQHARGRKVPPPPPGLPPAPPPGVE